MRKNWNIMLQMKRFRREKTVSVLFSCQWFKQSLLTCFYWVTLVFIVSQPEFDEHQKHTRQLTTRVSVASFSISDDTGLIFCHHSLCQRMAGGHPCICVCSFECKIAWKLLTDFDEIVWTGWHGPKRRCLDFGGCPDSCVDSVMEDFCIFAS